MRSERPLRDILGPNEARRMLASERGGGAIGGRGGGPPVARGSGSPPGGYTPETLRQLVQELRATGRVATPAEIGRMRAFLADQVLPTDADLHADTPAGRYAQEKYDEHVRTRQEWPPATTPADYLASLRTAVRSTTTGVRLYTDQVRQEGMLLFVARTPRVRRGPNGRSHLVVLFNGARARWVTGFQVPDGGRYATRRGGWWIQRPR
jgi:hypothetical protein